MLELLQHALSLVHGIVACVATFAVLSVSGLALLPRERDGNRAGSIDGLPAVASAALYAVLCWFGISNGIALNWLMAGYVAFIAALVALRRRHVLGQLQARRMFSRSMVGCVLAFALYYCLCYVFLPPALTDEFLPLKLVANNDIYWYITHTRFLQDLAHDNVDGFSFLGTVYKQTPAVFYLLGMLSAFFRLDPLEACMPTLFGFASLLALITARMSRIVFGVSRVWAVAIGCILICGPFFRYVLGSYFLSTMMALPVFIHLVWLTASGRSDRRLIDPRLWLGFTPHYALLLLLYPVLFFSAVAAQLALVVVNAVAEWPSSPAWRPFAAGEVRSAFRTIAGMFVSLGLVAGAMNGHLLWAWQMALGLSVKIAGWPAGVVSPLAVFGLPVSANQYALMTPAQEGAALAVYVIIAGGLLSVYFWRDRATATRLEQTLAGIAAGTLLAYVLYYLRVGYSYQQWRFASYFPLPWSFVTLAAIPRLVRPWGVSITLVRSGAGFLIAFAVAVLFVLGNFVTHVLMDPEPVQMSGAMRNLAVIDRLSGFRDIDVEMDGLGPTMIVPYFIRTKTLHMVTTRYSQQGPVGLRQISRQRPYFAQGIHCSAVGHDEVLAIEALGCLMFAPPAARFGVDYSFGIPYLPIRLDGFHSSEDSGRWNHAAHVQIEIVADDKDILFTPSAFANLHVSPLRVAGRPGQRMLIGWGLGRVASTLVTGDQWLSLPVELEDWRGGSGRQRTLVLSIGLPDAVAPSEVDPRANDHRPLAVFFGHLSLGAKPRGLLVVAPGETTR